MEKEKPFHLPLSKPELILVWASLKHVEGIVSSSQAKESIASLVEKLDSAIKSHSDSPYDTHLQLSKDAADEIDSAIHVMMTDAEMAKKFGEPADEVIGSLRLSQIYEYVAALRDILRRLEINTTLGEFENRISVLEETVQNSLNSEKRPES